MGIDGSVIEIVIVPDNFLHERFPLDNMILMLDKIGEYQKLCFRYFYGVTRYRQKIFSYIECQ